MPGEQANRPERFGCAKIPAYAVRVCAMWHSIRIYVAIQKEEKWRTNQDENNNTYVIEIKYNFKS